MPLYTCSVPASLLHLPLNYNTTVHLPCAITSELVTNTPFRFSFDEVPTKWLRLRKLAVAGETLGAFLQEKPHHYPDNRNNPSPMAGVRFPLPWILAAVNLSCPSVLWDAPICNDRVIILPCCWNVIFRMPALLPNKR